MSVLKINQPLNYLLTPNPVFVIKSNSGRCVTAKKVSSNAISSGLWPSFLFQQTDKDLRIISTATSFQIFEKRMRDSGANDSSHSSAPSLNPNGTIKV